MEFALLPLLIPYAVAPVAVIVPFTSSIWLSRLELVIGETPVAVPVVDVAVMAQLSSIIRACVEYLELYTALLIAVAVPEVLVALIVVSSLASTEEFSMAIAAFELLVVEMELVPRILTLACAVLTP